jgi:hypothetical protein
VKVGIRGNGYLVGKVDWEPRRFHGEDVATAGGIWLSLLHLRRKAGEVYDKDRHQMIDSTHSPFLMRT